MSNLETQFLFQIRFPKKLYILTQSIDILGFS